jgi:hypothetical protein
MTIKNYLSLVYGVVLAILCMGCENPNDTTEAGDMPKHISFMPQFIIENESVTPAAISLKEVYYYNDERGWVLSETGVVPVNAVVSSGDAVTLKTEAYMRADIHLPVILSFALTINDKHYVGWAAATGTGDLQGIVQYGLGYVRIIPEETNPRAPESVLTSTLTPKSVEQNEDRGDVTATYRVTITGSGVSFVLEKQSVIK